METIIALIGFGFLVWFFLHTDMDFIRWRANNIRENEKETERIKEQSKRFLKDIRAYNRSQKLLIKKESPPPTLKKRRRKTKPKPSSKN
jgi:hypothetical protein